MSLKGRKQAFKVARGEDGETDLEEYEITLDEGMVVLDCMHRIQPNKNQTWPFVGTVKLVSAVPVQQKSTVVHA